jgi:hypothetical protein
VLGVALRRAVAECCPHAQRSRSSKAPRAEWTPPWHFSRLKRGSASTMCVRAAPFYSPSSTSSFCVRETQVRGARVQVFLRALAVNDINFTFNPVFVHRGGTQMRRGRVVWVSYDCARRVGCRPSDTVLWNVQDSLQPVRGRGFSCLCSSALSSRSCAGTTSLFTLFAFSSKSGSSARSGTSPTRQRCACGTRTAPSWAVGPGTQDVLPSIHVFYFNSLPLAPPSCSNHGGHGD